MAPRAPAAERIQIDPHETSKRLVRTIARLENGETGLPPEVVREILAFIESTRGTVSLARTFTYARVLPLVAEKIGPDFLKPGPDTPERFRKAYAGYAGWTTLSSGAIAVSFWKWRFARAVKPYPPYLTIKVSKRLCAHKDEKTVISADEVGSIVRAAVTVRDQAFIATLYESGARVGELLGLRIGDVERTDYGGLRLHLPFGKTGRRTVPLFESSVPHLSQWLRDHPNTKDPQAPLWCGLQATDRFGEPMSYRAWSKIISLAAKRAGVARKVNPHAFRHSRATAIARNANVSTSVMESFFGWRPGSSMAAEYIHLTGHEVEDAMARAIGIEKAEAPELSTRLPLKCGRCSFLNPSKSRYCTQCAGPLSLEAVGRVEEAETSQRELARLLSRPDVRNYLARQLAAMHPARSVKATPKSRTAAPSGTA